MEILLSNLDWQLKGYWPFVPIKEKSMETGQQLHGVTSWIPATVPGGVHYDLYRAGLIENPYIGMDSLKCEWVENRWWMYRTTFTIPSLEPGRKVELIFEGLDYEAMIYVNDCLLAEHKGMYEACKVDITEVGKKENKLVVLFKGVPQEMGQIGFTSRTSTQKSRFNYKWDFSTRLVNIGFWKDVKLKIKEDIEIADIYIHSDIADNQGIICINGAIERRCEEFSTLKVKVFEPEEGACIYDNTVQIGEKQQFSEDIRINQPELWYPNGSGMQPLYTIKLMAEVNGKETPLCSKKIGIRSLSYALNERGQKDALPYTFVINGRKTYIKGVNITPIDHIYGNVTREQYTYLIDCAVNANVNMIRVWGGGLIEKEWLYELCDEKGILIWQEFIQSSSGIDNNPSTDPQFLQLLKVNSIAAIKEKRNHVSLTVWSGGNELMEAPDTPCGYDNPNIAMLKELVERYDPVRMFLPTSASGPRQFLSFDKGVSHDVHGSWRYEGNPKHYRMYKASDNLFHSEFGMDGTSNIKSLRKILPESALYPTPMSGNPYWQHHGEWWGTYGRDTQMFGPISDLSLFTQCSQYMQAEGLRFIIESDRRRKYQNSGCIVWQLNEPWPNASCTNLVDYFGDAKPAYYEVKRTYAEIHVSMEYQKLDYSLGELFSENIFLHNSTEAFEGSILARVRNLDGSTVLVKSYEGCFNENSCTNAGKLEFSIENVSNVFFVELKAVKEDTLVSETVYLFAMQKEHLFEDLKHSRANVELRELHSSINDRGDIEKTFCIRNTGKETAVQAGIEMMEDGTWMLADDNYVFLFPEEEKRIKVQVRRKRAGTFLSTENLPEGYPFDINFQAVWLGSVKP